MGATRTLEAVASDEGWTTVPAVARKLGLQLHTVYALVDKGDIPAEVTVGERRRTVRLRQSDVDAYIGRARVKPGELRHLYP